MSFSRVGHKLVRGIGMYGLQVGGVLKQYTSSEVWEHAQKLHKQGDVDTAFDILATCLKHAQSGKNLTDESRFAKWKQELEAKQEKKAQPIQLAQQTPIPLSVEEKQKAKKKKKKSKASNTTESSSSSSSSTVSLIPRMTNQEIKFNSEEARELGYIAMLKAIYPKTARVMEENSRYGLNGQQVEIKVTPVSSEAQKLSFTKIIPLITNHYIKQIEENPLARFPVAVWRQRQFYERLFLLKMAEDDVALNNHSLIGDTSVLPEHARPSLYWMLYYGMKTKKRFYELLEKTDEEKSMVIAASADVCNIEVGKSKKAGDPQLPWEEYIKAYCILICAALEDSTSNTPDPIVERNYVRLHQARQLYRADRQYMVRDDVIANFCLCDAIAYEHIATGSPESKRKKVLESLAFYKDLAGANINSNYHLWVEAAEKGQLSKRVEEFGFVQHFSSMDVEQREYHPSLSLEPGENLAEMCSRIETIIKNNKISIITQVETAFAPLKTDVVDDECLKKVFESLYALSRDYAIVDSIITHVLSAVIGREYELAMLNDLHKRFADDTVSEQKAFPIQRPRIRANLDDNQHILRIIAQEEAERLYVEEKSQKTQPVAISPPQNKKSSVSTKNKKKAPKKEKTPMVAATAEPEPILIQEANLPQVSRNANLPPLPLSARAKVSPKINEGKEEKVTSHPIEQPTSTHLTIAQDTSSTSSSIVSAPSPEDLLNNGPIVMPIEKMLAELHPDSIDNIRKLVKSSPLVILEGSYYYATQFTGSWVWRKFLQKIYNVSPNFVPNDIDLSLKSRRLTFKDRKKLEEDKFVCSRYIPNVFINFQKELKKADNAPITCELVIAPEKSVPQSENNGKNSVYFTQITAALNAVTNQIRFFGVTQKIIEDICGQIYDVDLPKCYDITERYLLFRALKPHQNLALSHVEVSAFPAFQPSGKTIHLLGLNQHDRTWLTNYLKMLYANGKNAPRFYKEIARVFAWQQDYLQKNPSINKEISVQAIAGIAIVFFTTILAPTDKRHEYAIKLADLLLEKIKRNMLPEFDLKLDPVKWMRDVFSSFTVSDSTDIVAMVAVEELNGVVSKMSPPIWAINTFSIFNSPVNLSSGSIVNNSPGMGYPS